MKICFINKLSNLQQGLALVICLGGIITLLAVFHSEFFNTEISLINHSQSKIKSDYIKQNMTSYSDALYKNNKNGHIRQQYNNEAASLVKQNYASYPLQQYNAASTTATSYDCNTREQNYSSMQSGTSNTFEAESSVSGKTSNNNSGLLAMNSSAGNSENISGESDAGLQMRTNPGGDPEPETEIPVGDGCTTSLILSFIYLSVKLVSNINQTKKL